jgi:hypothetical protein
MKKFLLILTCTLSGAGLFAQDNTPKTKKNEKIDMSNRANDHLLFQLGYANWSGIPDTINKSGFSKSINLYAMVDYPFKTNPHLSMAFGAGIASDHILFSKTNVGIKENTATIHFTNAADTNNFKKTKLATVYLEAPVEFRFSAAPLTGNGLKFAVGVKVGTLINAHTRNTKYQVKGSTAVSDHVEKEASKKFFNKNRLSVMGRVGYGHFSLFASYQFSPLFRDGLGPVVKPYSIGITLSGL